MKPENDADRRLYDLLEDAVSRLEADGHGRRALDGGLSEYSQDVAIGLLRDLVLLLYGSGRHGD